MSEVSEAGMVWLNGEITRRVDASIPVSSPGLLVGEGVFETLVGLGGEPFAFRRHDDRLRASAAVFSLPTPEAEVIRGGLVEVMAANGLTEGRLRVTVSRSADPERGVDVLLTAVPLPQFHPTADVVSVPFRRDPGAALSGIKSISYGENVVARSYARKRGGGEAIFGNVSKNLCEGATSNVFVVFEGRLVTPPLSSGCLAGVTRALVIDRIGPDCGIEAIEGDLPLANFPECEEAFLTSTTRRIHPIARVDGKCLGPTVPGPVTEKLSAAFDALAANEIDP